MAWCHQATNQQQTITWNNGDTDICHHMILLGDNQHIKARTKCAKQVVIIYHYLSSIIQYNNHLNLLIFVMVNYAQGYDLSLLIINSTVKQ